MDVALLAPCGYYCGSCVLYVKNKCLGCAGESKKAEEQGKVFCNIYRCAKEKNLVTCSDCESCPCEKYDKSIFAPEFIKWVREKVKG